MSRNEDIIQAILDGEDYEGTPQSRIEALLIALQESIGGGTTGGGEATVLRITKDVGDSNTVYTVQKTAQELINAMKTTIVIGILDEGTDYTTGLQLTHIHFLSAQYRSARSEYQFTSSWQTFAAASLTDKPTYTVANS